VARLLVVDDDPSQLELRRLLLEAAGHEVTVAQDSSEAIGCLMAHPPDILLMDLRLPEVSDGLELIRSARQQAVPVKIIVLSGWPSDLFDHPEAEQVDNVLTKPLRTRELLAAIQELL
jgi:CheY-like chemotaxis protein